MKYTIRIKNSMFGYERDQTMTVEADSKEQAIAAGQKIDRFANITIEKTEESKMTGEQIDDLIVTELKSVARGLAETVMLDNLDYDDSLRTLEATLEVISYYSTQDEYLTFINTLPDEVFGALMFEEETAFEHTDSGINVATPANSDLSNNLFMLGLQAYMAMAELGFISFEDMVKLAKIQLQSNGTKH